MSDKQQTCFYGGVPFSTLVAAGRLIKDLPPFDALTEREMAIHRRAYEEGYHVGARHIKEKVTHNLQMTFWGHVL